MFKLFEKKKNIDIFAMCDGFIDSIESCSDEVFSMKMIGDGFLIRPKSGDVYSPIKGQVVMVFPTKHAIGIKDEAGCEYIIHIGINTVNLKGEGFEMFVKEGSQVNVGDRLVRFDQDYIRKSDLKDDVILVFDKRFKDVKVRKQEICAKQKVNIKAIIAYE